MLEVPVIEIHTLTQQIVAPQEMADLMHPKERRLKMLGASKVKDIHEKKAAKKIQKQEEKKKIQQALEMAHESWKSYISDALVKATRSELLRKLQPGVVGKSAKDSRKNTQKTVAI